VRSYLWAHGSKWADYWRIIYQKNRFEKADDRGGTLVGFGLLWIPFMDLVSGQLFTYIQSVQAYITPLIAVIFPVGVMWSRVNSRGAIAALIVIFVLSVASLIVFSLLAPAPPDEKVRNLTYQTIDPRVQEVERSAGDPNRRRNDAIFNVMVLVVVAFVWWFFSG
jgi:SSS family solute:Na+ symporter